MIEPLSSSRPIVRRVGFWGLPFVGGPFLHGEVNYRGGSTTGGVFGVGGVG